MKGYLFAGLWEDGTAEITVSHNGTAEQRAAWARTLGGPKRILHGDIPLKASARRAGAKVAPGAGYMTPDEVLEYCAGKLGVPVLAFRTQHIQGGVSYLKEAGV